MPKSLLSTVGTYGLVFIWWLLVTTWVADPYVIYYLDVVKPDDSSTKPLVWDVIGKLLYYRRTACFVPLLIVYPHDHRLGNQRNWLLHSIGVTTLVLGSVSLLFGPWTKDKLLTFVGAQGFISGRAAALYMGMLLLAISRRSAILNLHGFGYLDLILFHKAAGWWCVVMTVIHSLAYMMFFLIEGGILRVWTDCFPTSVCFRDGNLEPCLNDIGLTNFVGLIGTIACIILAVFSREGFRRKMYEHFYIIHIVTGLIFVSFAAMHDFEMMIFARRLHLLQSSKRSSKLSDDLCDDL